MLGGGTKLCEIPCSHRRDSEAFFLKCFFLTNTEIGLK